MFDDRQEQQGPDWRLIAEQVRKTTERFVRGPEAEDVAQEALRRMWERRERSVVTRALITTVVRSVVIDRHRSAKAKKHGGHLTRDQSKDLTSVAAPATSVEQRVIATSRLAAAFAQLTPDERLLLRLWQQGWTSPEMADALSTTADAARARLGRALRKLRLMLMEDEED